MNDKSAYSSPEIVSLGDATEITESGGTPVAETPGSGTYYDSSRGTLEEAPADEAEPA